MKNIIVMAVLLLICQLCMTAIAGEMTDITAHNNFSARNGVPVNPPKISYVTNGKPLQGWVFTQSTGSTDIMYVSIDSGNNYISTANPAGGTGTYEGSGNPIIFNTNPGINKPVVLKMNSIGPGGNNNFFNNATAFDGWIRVKALGFSGYAKGGKNIGDGVWLGWADNVWALPKDDPNYQWDDLVFILQGVTPIITDGYGHTDTINLPPVIIGNRLIVTSWREENKYQP